MTQVLAVFAELERRLIGERTKDALAVCKAQGVKLGRPRTLPTEVVERIRTAHTAGASWSKIAWDLTTEGVPTAQGGARWYPATVRYVALADEPAAGQLPNATHRGPVDPLPYLVRVYAGPVAEGLYRAGGPQPSPLLSSCPRSRMWG